jgi:ssDNA-binding Zn-finger/Zn-ribbon topoisomerase 1
MQCPRCGHTRIFRDSYKGNHEWLRLTPFRPYGCRECLHRFISWRRRDAVGGTIRQNLLRPFLVFSAACPGCHSRELERINGRSIRYSLWRTLAHLLGFPAYRCAKCGKKFFKFRWHVRYTPPLET